MINPRILYVDSDAEFCDSVKAVFDHKMREYACSYAATGKGALEIVGRQKFELLIIEYCLFDMTGAKLCRHIREMDKSTPILIHTALYRDVDRETAMNAGANAYILKSDGISNLVTTVKRLIQTPEPIRRSYHARRSSSII